MIGKKLITVFMIVFTVMASSFAFYFYQVLYTPNILVDGEEQYFAIPSGSSFSDVQTLLKEQNVVGNLMAFSFLAKLKSYDESVKPGMYLLQPDMSNTAAVNLLRSGAQTPVKVTFSVARKLEDLPGKIQDFVEFDSTQLAGVLMQDSVAEKYGFEPENFISMFIPNTYEVYWNITPQAFLDRMKSEYDKFWTDARQAKAGDIGLTLKEVSTLASIVEAETKKMDEAPVVAGLYMNRLQQGMPLQADPTLVFAMNDFTVRRVLNKDKEIDSPYNTYLRKGLPPGPIAMPSIGALNAVLNYQAHSYLYMCAKPDYSGYHAFASNLTKHNANAAVLHRWLNQQGIYR